MNGLLTGLLRNFKPQIIPISFAEILAKKNPNKTLLDDFIFKRKFKRGKFNYYVRLRDCSHTWCHRDYDFFCRNQWVLHFLLSLYADSVTVKMALKLASK